MGTTIWRVVVRINWQNTQHNAWYLANTQYMLTAITIIIIIIILIISIVITVYRSHSIFLMEANEIIWLCLSFLLIQRRGEISCQLWQEITHCGCWLVPWVMTKWHTSPKVINQFATKIFPRFQNYRYILIHYKIIFNCPAYI